MSSANPSAPCQDSAHHDLHVCQLKRKGLDKELATRTRSANYLCHNCNETANAAEDLCNASPVPGK